MKSIQEYNKTTLFAILLNVVSLPATALPDGEEPAGYVSPTDSLLAEFDRLEQELGEVVVVGYGTQKRTQLTGSVATVKADVFAKSLSPTLDGALSGQVAGLNVVASSGQPGADSHIRIRGGNSVNASNEPL